MGDIQAPAQNAGDPTNDPRFQMIDARIERQTKYFAQWSRTAKLRYRCFNLLAIVFGALVPIIALVPPLFGLDAKTLPWVGAGAGIAGAIATLFKSMDGFLKNKDQWLRCSDALTKLHGERFLFQTLAGAYATAADPIALLAGNIENLLEHETQVFAEAVQEPATATQ